VYGIDVSDSCKHGVLTTVWLKVECTVSNVDKGLVQGLPNYSPRSHFIWPQSHFVNNEKII